MDFEVVQPNQGVLAGGRGRHWLDPAGGRADAAAGGGRLTAGDGWRAEGGSGGALAPVVHLRDRVSRSMEVDKP